MEKLEQKLFLHHLINQIFRLEKDIVKISKPVFGKVKDILKDVQILPIV